MTKPTTPENHRPLDEALVEEDLSSLLASNDEDLSRLLDFDDEELLSIDTSEVADLFWISVSGPLRLQADALEQLKAVMGQFPEITVELGTERRDW